MPWFYNERGRGWKSQVLSSLSLPPPPLLAIFSIVVLFLSLTWYTDCRAKMEEAEISLRFLFVLFPVVLIFIVKDLVNDEGRLKIRLPDAEQEAIHRAGGSPFGVAALIMVLLVLISYQSSFHSKWFRPLWWRSHY